MGGMRRALKPGGLLIIQGYTRKQLEYGTGGPKQAKTFIPSISKTTFAVIVT